MNSICFAVVGLHRGGTSATAEALHRLGVPMFEREMPADPWNPRGYFEDLDFCAVHEALIGTWERPVVSDDPALRERYRALVADRARLPRWGVKDPRLCFLLPLLADLFPGELRAVHVERSPDAAARSLIVRDNFTYEKAFQIVDRYARALPESLAKFAGPVHRIAFDDLVASPQTVVAALAAWAGLPLTPAAIAAVDPALHHHRA